MEYLLSSMIGILTAAGIYLILRQRTFPVIVGTAMLSYAVNLFLFASGRLARDLPPVLTKGVETYSDPLPQALVLTAIVISFGMTAVVVMVGLGAFLESDTDRIDLGVNEPVPDDLGFNDGQSPAVGASESPKARAAAQGEART